MLTEADSNTGFLAAIVKRKPIWRQPQYVVVAQSAIYNIRYHAVFALVFRR